MDDDSNENGGLVAWVIGLAVTLAIAVAVLAGERDKMAARYRAALASLDAADRASVFRADELAKGVDVPTFRQLEALVEASTRDLDLARKGAIESCQ